MEQQDRRSEYRRKAEQIVDKESLDSRRSGEELIYELKVHQIELEMQNKELQTSQQELHRSRRQFEMLFEYAPIAYFVFNEEGGVEEVNDAGAGLLKTERKRLHRKPFVVFLPREFHVPFFEHLRRVFQTGGSARVELKLLDRDGESRWVRFESRRQINPEGTQQCLTAVVDIGESRRDKADLAAAREDVIRARENTPVSSEATLYETVAPLLELRSALESILAGGAEGNDRAHQYPIAAARDATGALISTLEELRGEAGDGTTEAESSAGSVEPRELLATLETLLRPGYLHRKNTLTTEVDVPKDRRYVGDRRGVRQVLLTLMTNANEYTEGGNVTVRVRESTLSEELCELSFAVEDTGRGIEPERHRAVLQGKNGDRRGGLTIARQLVRRMGGQLYFESTPGVGSTFFFSLPLRLSSESAEARTEEPTADSPAAVKRSRQSVLVAEDNAINVLVLRTILERAGYNVVCVENGKEALEELRRYPHDLVLMDISMPVLDGLKATEEIRSGAAEVLDPKVPIIAITAHSMKGDKERFLSAGMDHYVSKPFSKEAVVKLVGETIAGRSS